MLHTAQEGRGPGGGGLLSMAMLKSPLVANWKSPPLAVIFRLWGGLLPGFWRPASGRTGPSLA